jgi:hypothetical protein
MGLGGVPNVSREISGNGMASVDRDVAGDDQDAFGVVLWEASPSALSVSKVVLETTQMSEQRSEVRAAGGSLIRDIAQILINGMIFASYFRIWFLRYRAL